MNEGIIIFIPGDQLPGGSFWKTKQKSCFQLAGVLRPMCVIIQPPSSWLQAEAGGAPRQELSLFWRNRKKEENLTGKVTKVCTNKKGARWMDYQTHQRPWTRQTQLWTVKYYKENTAMLCQTVHWAIVEQQAQEFNPDHTNKSMF